MRIQIGQRQHLQMRKRLLAHLARDTEGNLVIDDVHEPLAKRHNARRHGNLHTVHPERAEVDLSRPDNFVDRPANQDRHKQRPRYAHKRQQKAQHHQMLLALKILNDPF